MKKEYSGKNKIIECLISEEGQIVKKISEKELDQIITDKGVLFFPGAYESPCNVLDLVDEDKLKAAEAVKFLRLIKKQNLNKKNMIVVNKRKKARAANKLEIGKISKMERKIGDDKGTIDKKSLNKFVRKLKNLGLIAEIFNEKLNRVEYYVNPLYRKPGSRLSIELYGMFRSQIFKAMTVEDKNAEEYKKKREIDYTISTTNTYRDAIEQAYLYQNQTNDENVDELKEITLEVIATTKNRYENSLKEDEEIEKLFHFDKDKQQEQRLKIIETWLFCEPQLELKIKKEKITQEIFDLIKNALEVYLISQKQQDLLSVSHLIGIKEIKYQKAIIVNFADFIKHSSNKAERRQSNRKID
nr:MAG: hypothetical protein B6I27_02120 [Erwiniaceae bacterium 4572_131]